MGIMIGQELSFYPASYDDEQRMAEKLSRPRGDGFFDAVGVIAVGAVMTGGMIEPAPANTEVRTRGDQIAEETKRALASSALSPIIMRARPVDQAIDYQTQATYELAA